MASTDERSIHKALDHEKGDSRSKLSENLGEEGLDRRVRKRILDAKERARPGIWKFESLLNNIA